MQTLRDGNVTLLCLPEAIDANGDNTPEQFTRFCEKHLTVKPALAHNRCKRLGKWTESAAKPRHLLVHVIISVV